MGEWYLASLLVAAGACLALAVHAFDLARHTRARSYVYLLLLSVLEGAYCIVAYGYLRETSSARALPWGQAFCAFTPFITYVFGELTGVLTGRRPRWLVIGQRLNIAFTTIFVLGVLSDLFSKTELMIRAHVITDLASAHRHLLIFTPIGSAYLLWVSFAFACLAAVLLRDRRARREFAPITVACAIYFVATILDFAIVLKVRDGVFVQHFGFLALVVGCWRVVTRRLERSIRERDAETTRLEQQRKELLLAAPLMQKQKLDSVGTLAAGVAHEVNNPIQGILNYVQLLKRGAGAERVHEFADEIEREAKRVAEIVRQLLFFGRGNTTHAIAADVREIVQDTLVLLRAPLREDAITLDVRVESDVQDIVCHIEQLQHLLMNLITNAREALGRRSPARADEKTIIVRVSMLSREGTWVRFEVIDNGDGFDAETAERVFDPFFTTKSFGQGLGLGLSISHGIARAHGGTMSCESEPGRRTLFRFDMPCAPVDIAATKVPTPSPGASIPPPGASAHRPIAARVHALDDSTGGAFGKSKDERDTG